MLPELEVSDMRIDITVIITIVVTHYADKVLDVFDRKAVAGAKNIKTKIKDSLQHKKQKPDLQIKKRANVYQTLTLKNKEDYLHEIHEDNKK